MVNKKSLSKTSFWIHINRRYILFVGILVSTACVNGLLLVTPPDLQTAMDSAKKLRTEAEKRVKLVKNAETQGNINLSDSQTIQNSYGVTQQSFSTWIEKIQNDLRNKKLGGESIDYNKLSENAANQAKEFNALVDGILQISSRGDEMETIKSFIKAGTALVKKIKQIDQQKRQELILELENLRWKAYLDI